MTAVNSLDLSVLVFPVWLVPNAYYITVVQEAVRTFPPNYIIIYAQSMLTAFFQRKYDELKHSETKMASLIKSENGRCMEWVSYTNHVTCCGEVIVFAENMSRLEDIVSRVLGDSRLAVTDSTVSKRIEGMICNTEFELSKQIKGARFCRAIWRIH
jgi:hypothetical protein